MSRFQYTMTIVLITLWGVTGYFGHETIRLELAKIEASRGCK